MKTVALALLASSFLFACTEANNDGTASNEAAYSIQDPPRAVEVDAAAIHFECTSTHGSLVVLTFEDRIFTGSAKESLAACQARRQDLAAQTAPAKGTLVEEHGAINRGTLDLEGGIGSLESWGD